MQDVSDAFLAALRGPHQVAVKATLTTPLGGTVELGEGSEQVIEDGLITMDRQAQHRRQLDLLVAAPDLYPESPTDALNPYGQTITIQLGVRLATTIEYCQLGIYRIESVERDVPTGSLVITGWDMSRQVYDQRFLAPRKLTSQTAVSLIQLLIREVDPNAVFNVTTSDTTTIPKHVVDRDRWAEVLRVAQVVGCEVFPDAFGVWQIQDVPDPSTAPIVWSVDAGVDGVLVSANDVVTREGAPNIIVAMGESVSGNTAPFVSQFPHGYDNNPNSPTDYLGAYGKVPVFYSSPHIRSQAQADRVADAQLSDHLGVSRTIDFQSVPNPALEAGDAITVTRPDGTSEVHIIDYLTIPLGTTGAMEGETRAQAWNAE